MSAHELVAAGKLTEVDTLFRTGMGRSVEVTKKLVDDLVTTPDGAAYLFTRTGHFEYLRKAIETQGLAGIQALSRFSERMDRDTAFGLASFLIDYYGPEYIDALLNAVPLRVVDILAGISINEDDIDKAIDFVKRHGLSMDMVDSGNLMGSNGVAHLKAGTVSAYHLLWLINNEMRDDFPSGEDDEVLLTELAARLKPKVLYPQLVKIYQRRKIELEEQRMKTRTTSAFGSLTDIILKLTKNIERFSVIPV